MSNEVRRLAGTGLKPINQSVIRGGKLKPHQESSFNGLAKIFQKIEFKTSADPSKGPSKRQINATNVKPISVATSPPVQAERVLDFTEDLLKNMNWQGQHTGTGIDDSTKLALLELVKNHMEQNPNQPITEESLAKASQAKAENFSNLKDRDLNLSSMLHLPDTVRDAKEIQRYHLARMEQEGTDLNNQVSKEVLLEAVETMKENYKSGSKEFQVLTRIQNNLNHNQGKVTDKLMPKLVALLHDDTKSLSELIKVDEMYERRENITNLDNNTIETLNRFMGIEELKQQVSNEYNGSETKTYAQFTIGAILGNLPGGDTAVKLDHANNRYDEQPNSGTPKSKVLATLPKCALNSSGTKTALDRMGAIMIKVPVQVILRNLGRLGDVLTAGAVGIGRKIARGALFDSNDKSIKNTFKQKGLTRKMVFRETVKLLRNAKKNIQILNSLGLKTESKEEDCYININNLRNELADLNSKDFKTQAAFEYKKQNILKQIETQIKTLESIIKIEEKSIKDSTPDFNQKAEQEVATLNTQPEDFNKVQSSVVNNIRKQASLTMRDLFQKSQLAQNNTKWLFGAQTPEEIASDINDDVVNKKNKIAEKKELLIKLKSGTSELKDASLNNPIESSIEQVLMEDLTPETKQVLSDMKSYTEYYDTDRIPQGVIDELNLIQKTKPELNNAINTIKTFVKNNDLSAKLRRKDQLVIQGANAHTIIEYGGNVVAGTVGGSLASGIARILRAIVKPVLQQTISTAYSASNKAQYTINEQAETVANSLEKAEENILTELTNKTEKTPEETAIHDFLIQKKMVNDAIMGASNDNDGNNVHSSLKQNKSEFNRRLYTLKSNKSAMIKFQQLITNKLKEDETKDSNVMDIFQGGLSANNPEGNGFADCLLFPRHELGWAIKKFATSNLA